MRNQEQERQEEREEFETDVENRRDRRPLFFDDDFLPDIKIEDIIDTSYFNY